jgi:hypothetical protein
MAAGGIRPLSCSIQVFFLLLWLSRTQPRAGSKQPYVELVKGQRKIRQHAIHVESDAEGHLRRVGCLPR